MKIELSYRCRAEWYRNGMDKAMFMASYRTPPERQPIDRINCDLLRPVGTFYEVENVLQYIYYRYLPVYPGPIRRVRAEGDERRGEGTHASDAQGRHSATQAIPYGV